MAVTREITIWCDAEGCNEWSQESGWTLREIRSSLKRDGWTHRKGKDLCPEHSEEIR